MTQMPKPNSAPLQTLSIDKLNACVHCGLCLPTCATYQATGSEAESPRGRLYLMRKWAEGSIEQAENIKPYLDHCLACHACETVCPSGVQYGELLFQTRDHLASNDNSLKRKFKRFIFKNILPNSALLTLFQKSLRLYQRLGLQEFFRRINLFSIVPGLAEQEKLLPEIPSHQALAPGMRFGSLQDPIVTLMTGCVMDAFFNPIHWQTIFVLVKNGYQVVIPKQTCCGALAHHAGETDIAKSLAEENINTVLQDKPEWIVLNSAGCASTMQHYDDLLSEKPSLQPQASQFSNTVIDVLALLAKKPLADFPATSASRQTLLYHAACHLYHVQKVQSEPITVLRQLPESTIIPLENIELCCGSAGIYNLEYPDLADEMLQIKLDSVEATLKKAGEAVRRDRPVTLVSGNPGCLMQLAKGLTERDMDIELAHPVEILAQAYGYQGINSLKALQQ